MMGGGGHEKSHVSCGTINWHCCSSGSKDPLEPTLLEIALESCWLGQLQSSTKLAATEEMVVAAGSGGGSGAAEAWQL